MRFTTGSSQADPGSSYDREPFTVPVVTECTCGELPALDSPVLGELSRDSYPPFALTPAMAARRAAQ